jgi:hypothetical protein
VAGLVTRGASVRACLDAMETTFAMPRSVNTYRERSDHPRCLMSACCVLMGALDSRRR